MWRKVFVSYKYADKHVKQLWPYDEFSWKYSLNDWKYFTARNYVDLLQEKLSEDHINKGEDDGTDLSDFQDETIWSKLREKIFDSSVTIVLISKHMVDNTKTEYEQWIPWEIAYSLREKTQGDKVSTINWIIAVALPDENDSYEYIQTKKDCDVLMWYTDKTFKIIGKNMFNRKRSKLNATHCYNCNNLHHAWNDHSYIHPVRWDDFIGNINDYIEHAHALKNNVDDFEIIKTV